MNLVKMVEKLGDWSEGKGVKGVTQSGKGLKHLSHGSKVTRGEINDSFS